ncbi:MAG TPA: hypothetical protein PKH31_08750, partial [Candidatus Sumerlaeota bacterium]|nr:hypothetical protein [Candidatus Sumerlaeota bacterium]
EDMRSMVENLKKQNQFATDADLERALRSSIGVGINDFLKRARQNAPNGIAIWGHEPEHP